MDRADIYCLCFSPHTTYLACSSDKGTVHIFSLADTTTTTSGVGGGEIVGVTAGGLSGGVIGAVTG